MYIVLGAAEDSAQVATGALPAAWEAVTFTDSGFGTHRRIPTERLGAFITEVEARNHSKTIRWAWADARVLMPLLLDQGVSPFRAHDLRLVQRILVTAETRAQNNLSFTPTIDLLTEDDAPAGTLPPAQVAAGQDSLFEDSLFQPARPQRTFPTAVQLTEELKTQLAAIEASPQPKRLRLLAAAESTGGLIAGEMKFYGIPWNRAIHERILTEALGPRPGLYEKPYEMVKLAGEIRQALGSPKVNVDSPADLLKAMQSAGMRVESTRKWELVSWADENPRLKSQRHAVVDLILRYKKLSRLFSANGWNWLDEWVKDNRFYPAYEVGGVVTGRWGAHGGGAMQIPKDVRSAVQAEEGMILTVADASQVEPRILAAMSADPKLAIAGRDRDLYLGIAELGERTGSALTERAHAKIALLGAMYGATTGESGRLMPHLKKMFPQAIGFTEQAARIGERGGQVTTYLGRTSPAPSADWFERQRNRSTAEAERAAVSASRAWGRFTRNFVVQGTAAEWALCWMSLIRQKLRTTVMFGKPMRSHLVYFLHDEIMIYGPEREAQTCTKIVRESAQQAAELIFGPVPVQFPVTVVSTDNYAKAK
ncbi:bifunctional 3'-5' exonuclease/DNA polymerase [Rothia aerolata]|uniref:DNA-directed DNA polymerase n=1 Tax=Rothia aerolata TaxID=1812262 RepID=A0A917MSM3_9MICC|nr:bifunctional 3'-5' exonuclease/DNA polymerase [Rothia aerolata]GGH61193.1 bifunctional 3'-5' exonuclease/DNA polymerase [Rothia aerolata]